MIAYWIASPCIAHLSKTSFREREGAERQLKVLNRLIDYALRGGFEGGMSNTKYQKITGIGDRTALRDLSELNERSLMVKIAQLKGTRYYLNVPHLLERL